MSERTCPGCGQDRVLTVECARLIFRISKWGGQTSMLDYSDRVCSYCKAVEINGDWTRMQSVKDRAYELAQASSSKNRYDYRDILTAGPEEL